MSRTKTVYAFFCLLLCFAFLFSACSQKDNRSVIYENNFEKGNNNTFGTFGTIVENEDKSLTLKKSEDNNVGPISYFGKNENKNSSWVDRGLAAEITFELDPYKFETDESFNLTFTLNNKDFNSLAEVTVCFRKYNNGLRIGTAKTSGEETNITATQESNNKSKRIERSCNYTLEVSFYTSIKNEISYRVILKEEDGTKIYTEVFEKLENADRESVQPDQVGGFRSVSLSYMTTSEIKVKKLRLLEN